MYLMVPVLATAISIGFLAHGETALLDLGVHLYRSFPQDGSAPKPIGNGQEGESESESDERYVHDPASRVYVCSSWRMSAFELVCFLLSLPRGANVTLSVVVLYRIIDNSMPKQVRVVASKQHMPGRDNLIRSVL